MSTNTSSYGLLNIIKTCYNTLKNTIKTVLLIYVRLHTKEHIFYKDMQLLYNNTTLFSLKSNVLGKTYCLIC